MIYSQNAGKWQMLACHKLKAAAEDERSSFF
jgi:hypothetical protein